MAKLYIFSQHLLESLIVMRSLIAIFSKYCIINCSPGSQALLEVSLTEIILIRITLLLVCAICIWVLFLVHVLFMMHRTFNTVPAQCCNNITFTNEAVWILWQLTNMLHWM